MRVFDLVYCCRLFGEVAPTDPSWVELHEHTGGRVDLRDGGHRLATVVWLRKWGCRSLASEDTDLTLAAMAGWAETWSDRLPAETTLDRLTDDEIEVAADAYAELAGAHAAHRRVKGKPIPVTFGPTAAAKTLYALRPEAFLPWDNAIRAALGFDGSRDSYRDALLRARRELAEAVLDAGCTAAELPAFVGRPGSSPPKLIDEHDWARYTARHEPPALAELDRWVSLLRP